jgi:hypothetical protein
MTLLARASNALSKMASSLADLQDRTLVDLETGPQPIRGADGEVDHLVTAAYHESRAIDFFRVARLPDKAALGPIFGLMALHQDDFFDRKVAGAIVGALFGVGGAILGLIEDVREIPKSISLGRTFRKSAAEHARAAQGEVPRWADHEEKAYRSFTELAASHLEAAAKGPRDPKDPNRVTAELPKDALLELRHPLFRYFTDSRARFPGVGRVDVRQHELAELLSAELARRGHAGAEAWVRSDGSVSATFPS